MATLKQIRTVKEIMENRGISTGAAMIKAGYDPTTAKNPKNLTDSIGWQVLLERYLPDANLAKVHQEGLQATKIITSPTEPDSVAPDYQVRAVYLKEAYKLKNKYPVLKKVEADSETDMRMVALDKMGLIEVKIVSGD